MLRCNKFVVYGFHRVKQVRQIRLPSDSVAKMPSDEPLLTVTKVVQEVLKKHNSDILKHLTLLLERFHVAADLSTPKDPRC
jgi:histidinol phosphatase-like PHP family hydrolase